MIDLLLTAHRWDAYISIAWMFIAAIYGLVSHRRHCTSMPASYVAVLLVGEVLLAIQVALGLPILALGLRPSSSLHVYIYGSISPLLLPWTYLYTKQEGKRHPNLAFGLISLFLFAFLIRGTFTA